MKCPLSHLIFIVTNNHFVSAIPSPLRCSRRCWKSGRGGNWVRTLTRSTATLTAKRRTSRVAVSPQAICLISMNTMPVVTRHASTKLTESPLLHLRRTTDWLSPTGMEQRKADMPRTDTPCSAPPCYTNVPPVMSALPQRTCVWRTKRSAGHIIWMERKLTSEENSMIMLLVVFEQCVPFAKKTVRVGKNWSNPPHTDALHCITIHPSIIYHRLSYTQLGCSDWSLSQQTLDERCGTPWSNHQLHCITS